MTPTPEKIGPYRLGRLREIPGDASSRCYWRADLLPSGAAILCRYEDGQNEALRKNIAVLEWAAEQGIPVPEVLAEEGDGGWLLLQDLGSQDGEAALRRLRGQDRFEEAVRLLQPLVTLGEISSAELPAWNSPLDQSLLRWELSGFELWAGPGLGPAASRPEIGLWLDQLAEELGSHPRRICHRDYHLNNLLIDDGGRLGVIDIQDIRLGPDTYDLASLLVDRALPGLLDEDQAWRLAETWAEVTGAAPGWPERLTSAMLQRSLKVLGTFLFLHLKGATGYFRWVPQLAERTLTLAAREYADFPARPILLNLAAAGGLNVRLTRSP